MEIVPATSIPMTRYGSVRSQVSPIIDGPRSISWKMNGKDFWGTPVLTLSKRNLQYDQVESRSVYTNLFDKSRPFALLRSIYWNGLVARDQIHHKKPVDLTIQARFVILHKQLVRVWLKHFDRLTLSLDTEYEQDPLQPIKELRIELDYATWVFERRWQFNSRSHAQLEQEWNHVWLKMSQKVSKPIIPDQIEESYFPLEATPKYDLQTYNPNGM